MAQFHVKPEVYAFPYMSSAWLTNVEYLTSVVFSKYLFTKYVFAVSGVIEKM